MEKKTKTKMLNIRIEQALYDRLISNLVKENKKRDLSAQQTLSDFIREKISR